MHITNGRTATEENKEFKIYITKWNTKRTPGRTFEAGRGNTFHCS